jgi:glycyl-tRNA synthetase
MSKEFSMDKISALAKNRGFIYPGSEIYGGLANTWDYGPVGVELKNNVKKAWWKKFVQESKYNVGLDAAILMNPKTWVASGHVGDLQFLLLIARAVKPFRADKLIEDYIKENDQMTVTVDDGPMKSWKGYIKEKSIQCQGMRGGKQLLHPSDQFNLMFKTISGCYGGFPGRDLFKAGNSPGNLCQL